MAVNLKGRSVLKSTNHQTGIGNRMHTIKAVPVATPGA